MTKTKNFTLSQLKELVKEHNLLPFNREISPTHANAMQKSIIKSGILRRPIVGRLKYDKNKLAIIDGQHLVSAMTTLPEKYKIKRGECIVKEYDNRKDVIYDISVLNNTQKVWNDEQFLNAWYQFGADQNEDYYPNYIELYKKYNQGSLSCGLLVDIYTKSKDLFREGKLTFFDKKFSDEVYYLCNDLKNTFGSAAFMLHGVLGFCVEMHNNKKQIDWNRLKSRVFYAMKHKDTIKSDKNKKNPSRDEFREFVKEEYNRL